MSLGRRSLAAAARALHPTPSNALARPDFLSNAIKSLPIAGTVLVNEEIESTSLSKNLETSKSRSLARAREWLSAFNSLSGSSTVLQIRDTADPNDPGGCEKATVILAQRNFQVSDLFSIPALLVVHSRSTDPYNREFQQWQANRLADAVGISWLSKEARGIFFCVHHSVPLPVQTLEIGDHRVVCEFDEIRWRNNLLFRPPVDPGLVQGTKIPSASFPDLDADAPGVLSLGGSSIRPLGELPWGTLALGDPTCAGNISEFSALVNSALRLYGKQTAKIVFDRKSDFEKIAAASVRRADGPNRFSGEAVLFPSKIAVTAIPKGLTEAEQEALMHTEFSAHLPFLPWHTGRFASSSSGVF